MLLGLSLPQTPQSQTLLVQYVRLFLVNGFLRDTSNDSRRDLGTSSEDGGTTSSCSGSKRRKPGDCRCLWHSEWEIAYLVVYDMKADICMCLKCNEMIETVKKYSLQRHCECMHPEAKGYMECVIFLCLHAFQS